MFSIVAWEKGRAKWLFYGSIFLMNKILNSQEYKIV